MKSEEHNIYATVKLNGNTCKEYNVEEGADRVNGFIESKPDGQFTIELSRGIKNTDNFRLFVKLDGIEVDRVNFNANSNVQEIKGRKDGNTLRAFKYAPIKLSEETDECVQDEKIIGALGTIEIALRRVRRIRKSPAEIAADKRRRPQQAHAKRKPGETASRESCLSCAEDRLTSSEMTFDEKSKKGGLSLVADLGDPISTGGSDRHRPSSYRTTYIDTEDFLTFRFNYRTRAMLEAQGICSMDDPQDSPEVEDAVEPEVDRADAQMAAQLKRVKQENEDLRKKLKRQERFGASNPSPPNKKPRIVQGVIELDSD